MSVPWDIDHNLESKASLNSQEFICLGIMAVQWLARFPLEHSYSLSLHALVGFFLDTQAFSQSPNTSILG